MHKGGLFTTHQRVQLLLWAMRAWRLVWEMWGGVGMERI